ncbi:MAG: energy transducer TonB [Bacteroidia bacterium]|nr:energy transducer TonB [Bacteroidia bacterium]
MKNKLHIMKNRSSITDEEIRNYMNFDSVVSQYKAQKKRGHTWMRTTLFLLGIAGIAISTFVYWPVTPASTISNAPALEPAVVISDSIQSQTEPMLAATDTMNQERETNVYISPNIVVSKQEKVPPIEEELATPSFQYTAAEPAEGYPNLYEYFTREIRYPIEALKDSIQGIVSVSFTIDKEGKPAEIEILNSLGLAFDKEAQRLIENMPAWKPATLNGKPVAAKISLPFTFQIVPTNPDKK